MSGFDPQGGGSDWAEAWPILAGAGGLLLLYMVAREFLLRAFPLVFVVLVFVPLILFFYRQWRYRELGEVRREYLPLLALLRPMQRPTYLQIVERAMANLVAARDKVERVRDLLQRENLPALEQQLAEARRRLQAAGREERPELERAVRDLAEAHRGLAELAEFAVRFDAGRQQLAAHFRRIRIKLETSRLADELDATSRDEVAGMLAEVQTLDAVISRVDAGRDRDGPPPQDPAALPH